MTMLGQLIANGRRSRPMSHPKYYKPRPEDFLEEPVKLRKFKPLPEPKKPILRGVAARPEGRRGLPNKILSEYGIVLNEAQRGGVGVYRMLRDEKYPYVMKVLHKLAKYRGFKVSTHLDRGQWTVMVVLRTAD
jgi:hypothetical protein